MSYLYLMETGYGPDTKDTMRQYGVKIGITDVPWDRLRKYTSTASELVMQYIYEGSREGVECLERNFINQNLFKRVNNNSRAKEVFAMNADDAAEILDKLIVSGGFLISRRHDLTGYDAKNGFQHSQWEQTEYVEVLNELFEGL